MTPAIIAAKKAGVPHRVLEYVHDPKAESYGLEAAQLLGLDAATVFKTLVADADGVGLVCALVPVVNTLDLKALADAVGARKARMADVAAAERSSGYVVGGISPLGQRKQLVTVIDETAQLYDEIFVSAGRRGLEIALAPADLLRLVDGKFAAVAKE